jgi:uncharacterized protein (DUF433 family)
MSWRARIAIDPLVLAGKPVIRGTRLAVDLIVGLLGQGWSEGDIPRNYPGLTHDDIAACLQYASETPSSREGLPTDGRLVRALEVYGAPMPPRAWLDRARAAAPPPGSRNRRRPRQRRIRSSGRTMISRTQASSPTRGACRRQRCPRSRARCTGRQLTGVDDTTVASSGLRRVVLAGRRRSVDHVVREGQISHAQRDLVPGAIHHHDD